MTITIELEGIYKRKFKDVIPQDIILQGQNLYIQGKNIPIAINRLYDVFDLFEKEARYKYGNIFVIIQNNDEIKYAGYTSNSAIDYHISSIMSFGNRIYYHHLCRRFSIIPDDNEFLVRKYEHEFY